MTAREQLIEELKTELIGIQSALWIENVASFILADRKRICEPLVKAKRLFKDFGVWSPDEAIDQTLQNAGLLE